VLDHPDVRSNIDLLSA